MMAHEVSLLNKLTDKKKKIDSIKCYSQRRVRRPVMALKSPWLMYDRSISIQHQHVPAADAVNKTHGGDRKKDFYQAAEG